MKVLLALVFIFGTFGAKASDANPVASEKFISYLPLGNYFGQNGQGGACSVEVSEVNFPDQDIEVRMVDGDTELTKLIKATSRFGYKDYKKEFIQTDRSLIGLDNYNYVERSIRTAIVGKRKLYVVLDYSVVVNRSKDTKVTECIIKF